MRRFLSATGRFLFYSAFILVDILAVFLVWFLCQVTIEPPKPANLAIINEVRTEPDSGMFVMRNSWLKQSRSGLYEIYVEGDGFNRGVIEGKLGMELAHQQEVAFVSQIRKMIPSEKLLNYLKFFISFFNRNLADHVPREYQEEIYGESLYASPEFDFIAPPYYRMLNYHAAHDIGHALQDKNMVVGCTSFGAWGSRTDDHTLLIGRNFDFYVGDEFAKNKLIYFVKPDSGYRLMMVSWAGLIGTVSGMNEKGLTITINASKSEIPTQAAMPISLLAREILQYASTIEEAFAIAQKRKTFVSESLLIGSFKDNATATIEKTPGRTELYRSSKDYIVCSNHYQAEAFRADSINVRNMRHSSSEYRRATLEKTLDTSSALSVNDAAAILRSTKGKDGRNIGLGNEKSLNQLIAHHSVIFKPECLQVWVSTSPYQLGEFVCYDLNNVFRIAPGMKKKQEITEERMLIPADSFLYSIEYHNFVRYKKMREAFRFAKRHQLKYPISEKVISDFISWNPEYFETYKIVADYYADHGKSELALKNYAIALQKEVTTTQDRSEILASAAKLLK